MTPAARTYSLHGLRLEVTGWQPAAEALDARLRRLSQVVSPPAAAAREPGPAAEPDLVAELGRRTAPEPGPVAARGAPGTGLESRQAVLRFDFRNGGSLPPRPPERARAIYDPPAGRVLYAAADDLLYIEIGDGEHAAAGGATGPSGPRLAALCRPGEGWAEITALRPEPGDLWLLSHPLFTLPLCELAKRRGLFSLHAAGLCRNGRALLLPGQSGAGKSTLAVALARAGFGLLGDDTVFLRREGPRILAFPDEVDLTEESVGLLARSADDLRPDTSLPGARKRSLGPERLAEGGLVTECAPGWLVFPRIANREESALEPLPREEALLALAPEVLLTEPRASQEHLDVLANLVEASDCWRLSTGRDLAGAVRLLTDLTA